MSNKTYSQAINSLIIDVFGRYKNSVIYGQNIIAGSRISGLGIGLENIKNATVFNSTNTENALMALGLGCTLKSIPSLYIMKQHDFALLGLDHLVNTYNLIRNNVMKAPFIVLMVVVDSGYEGPQSNLNNVDDFASLTKANIHYLSTNEKIEDLKINRFSNNLHFLIVSQKNLKTPIVNSKSKKIKGNSYLNIYRFNNVSKEKNENLLIYSGASSIFHEEYINRLTMLPIDIAVIHKIDWEIQDLDLDLINKYKKIYLFSDSKSLSKILYIFQIKLLEQGKKVSTQFRTNNLEWTQVNSDIFELDIQKIKEFFFQENISI